jgi:antitoxin PrlF
MNLYAPIAETSEVNMTSKGQVLIPKKIRDRLGLVPGRPVVVGINDRGEAVVMSTIRARRANESPDQREARIRAAIDSVQGKYDFGGGTTDEIMRDLRGDRRP